MLSTYWGNLVIIELEHFVRVYRALAVFGFLVCIFVLTSKGFGIYFSSNRFTHPLTVTLNSNIDDPMDGGCHPNRRCVRSVMLVGGGHPKSKVPTLSLKKFSMMVSLCWPMMELTMVVYPSWFMKASIFIQEPIPLGVCGGGSSGVMETMGYGWAQDMLLLKLASMSFSFHLFLPKHVVGSMKWWIL